MKPRRRTTGPTLGLIVFCSAAWAGVGPSAAAAADKTEWGLAIGATATGGIPAFNNAWQFEEASGDFRARFAASSDYSPATSFGLQGGAQVWLPSGLGFFAEIQDDSQDVKSNIGQDVAFEFRPCRTCLPLTASAEGRTDKERFRRSETRFHLGVGYRLKIASATHLEATGGLTRFTLDQALAQELDAGGPDDTCSDDFLFSGRTCSFEVSVAQRDTQTDTTWGYNVGGGITTFVASHVGFGLGVRYSHGGSAEFDGLNAYDANGDERRTRVRVKTGGVSANASVRIRF
jgi:opacity protein-like surface antigen